MNTDIRLKLSFRNHPKTKKLAMKLGPVAPLNFIWLLMFVAESKPDGRLTNMDADDVAIAAGWDGCPDQFSDILVQLRLLDQDHDGTLVVHDWDDNNPWAAGAGQRSRRARSNARKKWGEPDEKTAQQTRSERLAAAREKGTHSTEDWQAILDACGAQCMKCGSDENIVKDHIVPIYQGGSDGPENLQPLCRSCNASKGPDTTDHRPQDVVLLSERLQNACKTPAKRLQDDCGTPAPSPSPSPSPNPTPKPKDQNHLGDADAPPERLAHKPTSKKPADDVDQRFEEVWAARPRRPNDVKHDALKAYRARINEGIDHADLLAGVERYRRYIEHEGKAPQYTKRLSTFLSPARHWAEPWDIVGRVPDDLDGVRRLVAENAIDLPDNCELRTARKLVSRALGLAL